MAVDSERKAGQWAAQVVRIGGSDPTLSLFAASDKADELLSAIGVSSRISEQANSLIEEAVQQRNTAQSLTDQAAVMETELQRLETEAQAAMAAAQAASEAATAAVIEQQAHEQELEAMLAVATNQRAVTEADYQLGVQARAQALLAQLGVDWAQVSPSGWVRPAGGWISSPFGWDPDHYEGQGSFHEGVDLAQSCWNPIVAAHAGTVTRAGWFGGYGNAVDIDHGGGLMTRYGHQPDGGIQVSVGSTSRPASSSATSGRRELDRLPPALRGARLGRRGRPCAVPRGQRHLHLTRRSRLAKRGSTEGSGSSSAKRVSRPDDVESSGSSRPKAVSGPKPRRSRYALRATRPATDVPLVPLGVEPLDRLGDDLLSGGGVAPSPDLDPLPGSRSL